MRRLLLVGLRMPLDAEREAAVGRLEGLGQLVDRRPAGDLEALADAVDGLVVVGLGAVGTSPAARAASEPSCRRTSWSAPSKEPGCAGARGGRGSRAGAGAACRRARRS